MKRISYGLLLVLLVASTVLPDVTATAYGENLLEKISLRQAVSIALQSNDLIRAEKERTDAAKSDADYAKSYLLPKVTFEERFMRTDNPAYDFSTKINQGRFTLSDLGGAPETFNNPDPINDFQTSISFEMPIYVKRATLGFKMASTEVEAVKLDFKRKQEEIVYQVYRAYLGALTVEAYLETARMAEQDAMEHLRIAQLMETSGVGLASDRLRAQVAVGEAMKNRLKVENNLEIAQRGLGLVLGRESPVVPADKGLPISTEPAISELLADVEERSDIRAMSIRVENGANNVELAGAGYLPDLAVFGALQANDHSMPLGMEGASYRVGAVVQWTLFNGFGVSAKKAKARAELKMAENFMEGMKKEARYRVQEAYLRLAEARKALIIAENALQAAEEGTRLVRLRYENGLSPLVALLDSQTALNNARADVVKMQMDVRGALGDMNYLAGSLLKCLTENVLTDSNDNQEVGI